MALKRIEKPTGRHYELPTGKVVPSVTNYLGCRDKPALVPWAAKEERLLCSRSARVLHDRLAGQILTTDDFVAQLEAEMGVQKGYEKALKAAGDYGTAVHNYIEHSLKQEVGLATPGEAPQLPIGGELSWAAYQQWRIESPVYMRLMEVNAYSVQHNYAGTVDWVGVLRDIGRNVVGDWKTSKSMHREQVLQAVAYVMALVENGILEPPVDALIVRLPKELSNPGIEVLHITWEQMPPLFTAFLATCEVWRDMNPGDEFKKHRNVVKYEAPLCLPII